ncbi:uncharacterized protein LOC113295179 [Papaver somniferum]|uniref:uncharacterized protein LOC113295179 n=1 Tax=Papaver somniferum TaxID=3469 RepID=UPI000E6F4BD1|nr:uncharacterized protein LOC113295179 [Papaver somniferum]
MENNNAKWVQLFSAKYLQDHSFWNADAKKKGSSVWHGLMQVRSFLENKIFWQISSGNSVKIWEDPWIPNQVNHLLPLPDILPENIMHVSDLMTGGNISWNIDILHQLFSQQIVDEIQKIFLNGNNAEDILIWSPTVTGKFSTKSCYKILSENIPSSSAMHEFPWRKFWSFSFIPPKIMVFTWKLIYNGLPVNQNIKRFVSQIDPSCTFCKQEEESIEHLFFNCPWSVTILENISREFAGLTYTRNSRDVIMSWIEETNLFKFTMGLCVFWNIWKMRNEMVFSDASFSARMVIKKAHIEYNACIQDIPRFSLEETITETVSWQPSDYGYSKIGSSRV